MIYQYILATRIKVLFIWMIHCIINLQLRCTISDLKKMKTKIQKCFVGRNNDLPIYTCDKNKGFVYLDDTLYHKLTIKVYDFRSQENENKDSEMLCREK